MLGGLRSAIINEVLQFVLIWAGAALIPILGLIEAGGWTNLKAQIAAQRRASTDYTHLWSTLGHFQDNPMGVHWTGIVFGLGFVVCFGYWTTDFLVVQRVLSAHNLRAAKMAPVIGAAFKMAVPFIVILPGLLALASPSTDVSIFHLVGQDAVNAGAPDSYNEVLPLMLIRYCGPGLLGLGITALVAGFMSGMAGNVSAFSTVWTYDIYGAFINKTASDPHYVLMGRWSTVIGMVVSIATAYLVMHAPASWTTCRRCSASSSRRCLARWSWGCCGSGPPRRADSGACWSARRRPSACSSTPPHGGARAAALARIALSTDAPPHGRDPLYRALWSWCICVVCHRRGQLL